MTRKTSLCLFFVLSLVLAGCGTNKIPFTQALRAKYQLTPEELCRLQYYVSEEAVLRKFTDAPAFHEIKSGQLFTRSERRVDDVILKKDTPGILDGYNEDKKYELNISFEVGTSFAFSSNRSDKFSLKARDSLGRRYPFFYKDAHYMLMNEGDDIHLLISKQDLDKLVQKKRVLPGRKVQD